jgi:hypothetical protein
MFSTSLTCSIEYNFKYYQKNTTTSFIELYKKATAANKTNILRSSCHVHDNVVRLKKKYLSTFFHENPSIGFHKNATGGSCADTCGQMGRHDEANKCTSPFMRKCLKTPKMC